MSLPADQDTTTLRKGYVIKERAAGDDHVEFIYTGSVALNQGDFLLAFPYFGIIDEDVAAGNVTPQKGTLHVGQVYTAGAASIGTSQTFYTRFQGVYFDPADSKFYEASDSGRVLAGYVRDEASASKVPFSFEGLRPVGPIDLST